MNSRIRIVILVGTLVWLWGHDAVAKPKIVIHTPSTLSAKLHVDIAGGQVWSARVTSGGGPADQYAYDHIREELVVPLDVTLACPDGDEKLTAVKAGLGGSLGDTGQQSVRISKDLILATKQDLLDACVTGSRSVDVEIGAACDPAVGSPDPKYFNYTIQVAVVCDPSSLTAQVAPANWEHRCPTGYELDDASPHGWGTQSAALGTPSPAQCRRIDATKRRSPRKPTKSPEQLAEEKYQHTLALGRDALALLNLAGYHTIYELAHASSSHLSAVLGVSGGKKVKVAAQKALGTDSVVDPNWTFDEYFLIRPAWKIDPRLRGTKNALNRIDKAQSELWKLQKKGIVTLYHLAQADPHAVATTIGATDARGSELVSWARDATEYNGNDADLAIHRDWIIHPAWMIDPGLLPSARVVRRAAQVLDRKPTVSTRTPPDPLTTGDAVDSKPRDPKQAVPYRDLPGIDPASPLGRGPKGTRGSKRRRPPSGGRGRGGRGSRDAKPRGEGSRRDG